MMDNDGQRCTRGPNVMDHLEFRDHNTIPFAFVVNIPVLRWAGIYPYRITANSDPGVSNDTQVLD